ncbi:MAG: hypothetical protein NTW94_01930 [Legionellales bacterium]|nr:hypothetical protein [Legionellales bacterium]
MARFDDVLNKIKELPEGLRGLSKGKRSEILNELCLVTENRDQLVNALNFCVDDQLELIEMLKSKIPLLINILLGLGRKYSVNPVIDNHQQFRDFSLKSKIIKITRDTQKKM